MAKNKLKIGDRVLASRHFIDWHSSHLCWSYSVKVDSPKEKGYSEGEREFSPEDLWIIGAYCYYEISGKKLKGIVTRYCADAYNDKNEKTGKKCVEVEFDFKDFYKGGKYSVICDEDKDLINTKKRKR